MRMRAIEGSPLMPGARPILEPTLLQLGRAGAERKASEGRAFNRTMAA